MRGPFDKRTPLGGRGPLGSGSSGGPQVLALGSENTYPLSIFDNKKVLLLSAIGQSKNGWGHGGEVTKDRIVDPRIKNIYKGTPPTLTLHDAVEPLESNGSGVTQGVDDFAVDFIIGYLHHVARKLYLYEPTRLTGFDYILLYRHFVGGTAFVTDEGSGYLPNWDWAETISLAQQWRTAIDTIHAGIPNARLGAVYFDVGEEDIVAGWTQAQERTKQNAFVDGARTYFGIPDLPFIWGTVSIDAISGGLTQPILLAQLDTVNQRNWTGVASVMANSQSGYADDVGATGIGIDDEARITFATYADNNVHLSAVTERTEYASRFVKGTMNAENNNNLGGTPSAQTVPDAPTSVVLVAKDTYALAMWTEPASNGGAPVRYYEARYSTDGGTNWTAYPGLLNTTGKAQLKGLTNGTLYTVQVRAVNKVGAGAWSASAMVTPAAINLLTNLQHRLSINVGGSTIIDTIAAVSITNSGGTFATQTTWGPYLSVPTVVMTAAGNRVFYAGVHGTSFTRSKWLSVDSFAAALRALGLSEFASDGTTLRWRLYYNNNSGANSRILHSADTTNLVALLNTIIDIGVPHLWTVRCSRNGGGSDDWSIWKDGVKVAESLGVTARTTAAGDLWATGYANANAAGSNGISCHWSDDCVWNIALTDEAIALLYSKGPNGTF